MRLTNEFTDTPIETTDAYHTGYYAFVYTDGMAGIFIEVIQLPDNKWYYPAGNRLEQIEVDSIAAKLKPGVAPGVFYEDDGFPSSGEIPEELIELTEQEIGDLKNRKFTDQTIAAPRIEPQ